MIEETGFSSAIRDFNDGRFFECHDTLEAIWVESSGESKVFLQGLIQVAVGFYHFSNRNPSGALSLWGKGSGKLSGFAPAYAGIDIDRLLGQVREWSGAAVRALEGNPDPAFDVRRPGIDIIHNSLRREPWLR